MEQEITLKILRGTSGKQYWEYFPVHAKRSDNIITLLMQVRKEPINQQGVRVEPVIWEQSCLENVCGSCSMLINGVPRQACSTLVGSLYEEMKGNTIVLAPFSKFPVVRDLQVNRKRMFDDLKDVKGWIGVSTLYSEKSGPKISPTVQQTMYKLSTCMSCACCLEACPQVNFRSKFIGPSAISQVRLFNLHPTGKSNKHLRLKTLMREGGIADCGNAQNCVRVCPKHIPLTESIAAIGRDVTLAAFAEFFSLKT